MTANPFAALLDGVRRYSYHDYDEDDGFCLREKDVLAALAADVPDDLAEAGKVLEGVTPGPWVMDSGDVFSDGEDFPLAMCLASRPANARFIAWCREGVPALIARIAAMEARIATMIDPATVQKMLEDAQPIMAEACRGYDEALAAEKAKVAKLVEALEAAEAWIVDGGYLDDKDPCTAESAASVYEQTRAAITEAGQ